MVELCISFGGGGGSARLQHSGSHFRWNFPRGIYWNTEQTNLILLISSKREADINS